MADKICAMIPAKKFSSRCVNKNLRNLKGFKLAEWASHACRMSGCFDEIWLFSAYKEFRSIAMAEGIQFYQEPLHLAENEATNDEFAYEFIKNVPCDVLVQVNTTSPFVSAKDIAGFMQYFKDGNYDTLHTVKKEQIEVIYRGQPLNFDPTARMQPSQALEPAFIYTSSIMAWKTPMYIKNMRDLDSAVHGGNGLTGYYELHGLSTIDIDTEEDFLFAEKLAEVI